LRQTGLLADVSKREARWADSRGVRLSLRRSRWYDRLVEKKPVLRGHRSCCKGRGGSRGRAIPPRTTRTPHPLRPSLHRTKKTGPPLCLGPKRPELSPVFFVVLRGSRPTDGEMCLRPLVELLALGVSVTPTPPSPPFHLHHEPSLPQDVRGKRVRIVPVPGSAARGYSDGDQHISCLGNVRVRSST